jgi:hypothetical protein
LKQNFPNPMNPETRIRFTVGAYPDCNGDGNRYSVSLTIFNTLGQPFAIPVVQAGSGVAGGQQLRKLTLSCGEYTAYWNGKSLATGREAPSGVYPYHLEVDGHVVAVRKMIVTK